MKFSLADSKALQRSERKESVTVIDDHVPAPKSPLEDKGISLAEKTNEMIKDAKEFHDFAREVKDTIQNDETIENALKGTKRKRK